MADTDTDTTTAPAPGTVSPDLAAQLPALIQRLGLMPQPVQQDTTPVSRSGISLLGEALAGGAPVAGMSDADKETAGTRALMNFSTGLMAASRYQPGQTIFSNLAQGFQGAQRGEIGAEEMAMAKLGAQQEYAQQQGQNKLEAIKTALPLLQLQARQGLPSPFAQGAGGPPAPNVAQGGSIAAPAFTGDLEKDRQIIAQRESGGNPTALNYVALADPTAYARGATASGKYQFVNSTWQDGLKLAGLDPSKYPTAMSAPESVQDQVFTAVYKRDGTKPWDASTFKQNWVPTPTGQMILANVVPGGAKTAAAPAATAAPPAAPAPYKVATTGPIPPPPSGTPTAPATPDLPVPPIPPPTAPSPQQTPQADQPPPQPPVTTPPAAPLDLKSAPDTTLNPEQYVLKHWTPLSPEEVARYAPGPDNQLAVDRSRQVQQAQADAAAARQTYLNVQSGRVPGDLNKSLSDMNTADARADAAEKDYNTAVQGLKTEGAKNLLAADDQQRQQLRTDFKSIVTDPAQKARELAQTAAQAELERQNKIDIAKLQAGQTWHQKLQEQSAQNAQDNTLKPMAEQAAKAHNMNLSLAQLQPLLQDLPPGGGALGAVLNDHPDLAPLFNQAGILNDKSADAVRLVNGLVSNISTQMKPTGLGALREYEWDAFKSQLPSMLSTPAGQQKAIALLMNMNNRIGSEASWMNNYFSRRVPDDMSDKPGATMPAHNLDSDNPTESVQQRMDRELGPIVPSAPPGTPQGQWEQSLPPGKPYYKTWAQGDPKDPSGKTPLRDASGNVQTKTTLEVRPWR